MTPTPADLDYPNLHVEPAPVPINTLVAICDDPSPVLIPKDVWFVWQKRGHPPRFAHATEAAATAEAARLAARWPGTSFIVMHATHKLRVEAVEAV